MQKLLIASLLLAVSLSESKPNPKPKPNEFQLRMEKTRAKRGIESQPHPGLNEFQLGMEKTRARRGTGHKKHVGSNFARECADAQNRYRYNEGLSRMSSSETLIQYAESRAAQMAAAGEVLAETNNPYAEETFMSSENAQLLSGKEISKLWHDASNGFGYSGPGLSTQTVTIPMLRRGTRRLGCALAQQSSSSVYFAVCEYDPPQVR